MDSDINEPSCYKPRPLLHLRLYWLHGVEVVTTNLILLLLFVMLFITTLLQYKRAPKAKDYTTHYDFTHKPRINYNLFTQLFGLI